MCRVGGKLSVVYRASSSLFRPRVTLGGENNTCNVMESLKNMICMWSVLHLQAINYLVVAGDAAGVVWMRPRILSCYMMLNGVKAKEGGCLHDSVTHLKKLVHDTPCVRIRMVYWRVNGGLSSCIGSRKDWPLKGQTYWEEYWVVNQRASRSAIIYSLSFIYFYSLNFERGSHCVIQTSLELDLLVRIPLCLSELGIHLSSVI